MIFSAQIKVMPLTNLLDPQGKAVLGGLANLGITGITDARIGKQIDLTIEASNADEAKQKADDAAKKLLANAVMEQYDITINQL
jgi:phosphoribosylformylglycinamidine synthase subunit PurS